MKTGAPPRRRAGEIEPPARPAQQLEQRQHGRGATARRHDESRRDERIRGLEGADQRQTHLVRLAVMLDGETLSEPVAFRG